MSVLNKNNTLIDLLLHWADVKPDQNAFLFLRDGETEEDHISYRGLLDKSSQISRVLSSYQLQGERVVLLYPAGLEYIGGFFGCMLSGAIAVPAYPPESPKSFEHLEGILKDSGAKVVLSTQSVFESNRFKRFWEDVTLGKEVHLVASDQIDTNENTTTWQPLPVNGNSLAFLQYTSGSTSAPKGVMVSHSNILHNSEVIHQRFQTTGDSFCVSWLPLYHDMGLIGTMLQPFYMGFTGLFMSPFHFVQKPWRWLNAISKYRANISGGPNFGYDLCVQKINLETCKDIDLSCWDMAFNGGEPVHYHTIKKFADKFSALGFRWKSISSCYGMAESTLMISGNFKTDEPELLIIDDASLQKGKVITPSEPSTENTRTLVGNGHWMYDSDVCIVNPETLTPCDENEVGEILVAGKSVTQGYWNNKKATESLWNIKLDGRDEHFFRTGDLGFIANEVLFVTGRIKEVIIVRGQNYYPNDIEKVVQSIHPSLVLNGGAAFTTRHSGKEELIIVQEVLRHSSDDLLLPLVGKIKSNVFEHFGLKVSHVVFVLQSSIPKTTSGKIQRLLCRQRYESNQLKIQVQNT